ncbi:Uma2 family endonuclease [Streptomyces noursei]|uniref:Uma2 family endonuclease n=1 Tax=Streptomyces noursei TaxID=1971 RepID=UPI0035D6694F
MTEQTVYRHVRALRDHLTPLPGLTRPEISDGTLVMTMRPRPRHQLTASEVRDLIKPQLPAGMGAYEATDTDDDSLGKLRIPDVLICPRAAMDTDEPLDPREIVLAIEVVSPSNPSNDYEEKSRDYPAMGTPPTTRSSTPATGPGPTSGTSTPAGAAPPTPTASASSRMANP